VASVLRLDLRALVVAGSGYGQPSPAPRHNHHLVAAALDPRSQQFLQGS